MSSNNQANYSSIEKKNWISLTFEVRNLFCSRLWKKAIINKNIGIDKKSVKIDESQNDSKLVNDQGMYKILFLYNFF